MANSNTKGWPSDPFTQIKASIYIFNAATLHYFCM